MGDLTKNLSRKEFDCRDGKTIAVDYALVIALQDVRDAFARASGRDVGIRITSAYRSPEHNRKVGGAKGSMHLTGKAVDFHLYFKDNKKRINPRQLYKYLDEKHEGKYGLSLYSNRVHFDVRDKSWRSPQVTA